MSSSTIRYSGVPENSHSRGFATDTAAYGAASRHEDTDPSRDRPDGPSYDSELTRRFRTAAAAEQTTAIDRSSQEPAASSGFVPGFTPGKAGPVGDDPRHNRVYPHPKNPGLFAEADGFYDWADRRLFLADGSPDPMTPGAYRYQTRPDLCDLDASDADPASPRYEPEHLRHQPGDTWIIDRKRPYDVLDPGPYGNPFWFPDLRTGRHRRGELPDPVPWWEIEEEPEKAEWAEKAEALWERRIRKSREREAREREAREVSEREEQAASESREVRELSELAAPEAQERESREQRDREDSGPDRPGGSAPVGRAEQTPPKQSFDRARQSGPVWRADRGGNAAAAPAPPPAPDTHGASRPPAGIPGPGPRAGLEGDEPHRFSKLREDAWDQFLLKSAPLAAAHHQDSAGRAVRIVRRLADALRRTRRRYRKGSRPEGRPPGAPLPRQRTRPRPVPNAPAADTRTRVGPAAATARAANGPTRTVTAEPARTWTGRVGTGTAEASEPARSSARMAAALRGARRARAEIAVQRGVPATGIGGAAWA